MILPIAIQKNRYFSNDILYPEHLRNLYDIYHDTYNQVIDFSTLHKYVQNFVEAKYAPYIYGIRNHPGPLSSETYLIQEDLLKFFEKGYITQDSEAGLILNSTITTTGYNIQRPYLFLFGEKEKIQKMYEAIGKHNMLSAIDHDTDVVIDAIFNDFTGISLEEEELMREKYTFGFFGIRYPDEEDYKKDYFKTYFEYILSNQFFQDLLEIA
jgi:hypothetical protein